MSAYPEIARIFGWNEIMAGIHSDLELAELVASDGFPIAAMDRLVDVIGLAEEARNRLVPRTTYARLKRAKKALPEDKAENVLHVARAFSRVLSHFGGDLDEARSFWQESHPELNGMSPGMISLTEPGARAVEEIIDRIRFGFPV
jgi:putative toxin-antitoxin system antitoxin component (TIGR02293 family)